MREPRPVWGVLDVYSRGRIGHVVAIRAVRLKPDEEDVERRHASGRSRVTIRACQLASAHPG